MKRGDKCYVCYDGKWGRRVLGEVIATKYKRIQVRFPEWASDDGTVLTHWFHQRTRKRYGFGRRKYYGGFVPVKQSLMGNLFGLPGDWYRVFKCKKGEIK
jgi:hypothetical protein